MRDADPDAWLAHIAAFDFGRDLVHGEPFPRWTPALQAMVARQWQGRIADPGPDGLRARRDRLAVRIARLQGEGAPPTGPHPAFAHDHPNRESVGRERVCPYGKN